MLTFAAPTPQAGALIFDTTIVPGSVVLTAAVEGSYFTTSSVIIFNGDTLPTTFISSSQISAVFPSFFGNFPLYVYTPPLVPFLNDGGNSDTLYFFSTIKKNVQVIADNSSKRYGEKLPVFTATILVDSVPLAQSGLTYADLGLSPITFNTPASGSSNAGIYFIQPIATVSDPGITPFLIMNS
jgi:hypothetical protein